MSEQAKELGCGCRCCKAVREQLDALRDEVSQLTGLVILGGVGTRPET